MAVFFVEELKTYVRLWMKKMVPVSIADRLRVRHQSRKRKGLKATIPAQTISQDDLVADLRRLGLKHGQDVLIHSAISRIGRTEEGAATIVAAISEVIGPEATMLVPAYPMPGTMYDWMSSSEPFNLAKNRSRMGALTEYMRHLPGAKRSAHPTHSVVAVGPKAEDYTSEHHLGPTPTGRLSPFYKLIESRGQIICLGTGIGKMTSYHVVEDLMPEFPLNVYLKEPMSKTVELDDGRLVSVQTRICNPALSPWRVDNFKPMETEIYGRLTRNNLLRENRVGKAQTQLLDAQELFDATVSWAEQGQTIYHKPVFAGSAWSLR